MKKVLFLFTFIIVLFSCNNENANHENKSRILSPKVDSLYTLVVAKHDEVMHKTSDISKLSRILRTDMENMGNDKNSEKKKERIIQILTSLQAAHDAMFDWMGEFKGITTNEEYYKKTKDEELLKYLHEEEIKIDRVAKIMLESIGNAELYLKENDKQIKNEN